jgi:hypothetical protein
VAELFASPFLIECSEPEQEPPTVSYDEELSLSVLSDGRVYVEQGAAGATATITRADGEADDYESDDSTITEAGGEHDTWASAALGTKTGAKGEADDWAPTPSRPGTEIQTFAERENDVWT